MHCRKRRLRGNSQLKGIDLASTLGNKNIDEISAEYVSIFGYI
jgi:hypothetical protein